MSLYDYRASLELGETDPPFAALIMAAMRKADSINILLLRGAFPEIWQELEQRYHAPGGLLPEEGDGRAPVRPATKKSPVKKNRWGWTRGWTR